MLRGIIIAVIVGTAAMGVLYFGGPIILSKTVTDPLQHALDQIQAGLTYDKFVNMVDSQRNAIIDKMPQKTIDLMMDEAKKFPTTVSESMQEMISKISSNTQSVIFSKQGEFVGLGHEAKGKAEIISVGKIAFLRFENFEVTNGPDLHVYMTSDGNVTSGIDLGKLKGSKGDQNYALNGIDIKTYHVVVIYSQPFHVYFAEAKLS
ncbi:MAG: DM13 domain-containing protein [Thaumarchaeota archaeon]|nr:MAG: DM13 domain-containing protein [Nitrososphaerota archaeon]